MRFIYAFFIICFALSMIEAQADPPSTNYKNRGYAAGSFHLEIGNNEAGWIQSVEGGHATSDVVQAKNSSKTALPLQKAPVTPQLQTNNAPAPALQLPCATPPCTTPVRNSTTPLRKPCPSGHVRGPDGKCKQPLSPAK